MPLDVIAHVDTGTPLTFAAILLVEHPGSADWKEMVLVREVECCSQGTVTSGDMKGVAG